jgi:DNA sulfur modification protein DndB
MTARDNGALPLLAPLVTAKAARQKEFARRKDTSIFQGVHPSDVAKFEADGWTVHREGSRKVRIKKAKNADVMLEDQTWCLFYRMGYPDLSGPRFKIRYTRQDGSIGDKQVDVFAKDDETVILVECKARETRGKRTLQKDLHETESMQRAFANSVRSHYGGKYRPKIVWMYVTNNIIWSEPDLARAAAINVRVVTENEMQYFDSFIRHMGPAGRFQFLSEFLAGQDIPGLSDVKVPATKGTLGKHKFYSFLTTPRHLLKIAYVNHLALNHPDGRPAYQRMITPSRIKEIGGFIKKGGFFPTNLLINFTQKCRFDLLPNKENSDPNIKFGWLYLPNQYKSAWVIDGQHRLYGYSHLDEKYLDQSVAVIAFEEMDTKDEADLFVTINHKQKSVPRSVIVSLQADLKWGSDDSKERLAALCSRLTKTLNSDPTSPLFQRFSAQGIVAKENQSLTMPEVVNGLNRSGLIGKTIQKNIFSPGPLSSATDDETNDRARRVLNGYFGKIRDSNPVRWDAARSAYVSTNPGIRAQLLLLADLIRYVSKKDDIEPQLLDEDTLLKHVLRIAEPMLGFIRDADDADIYDKFARKFGEGGMREYADNLSELILGKFPDFGSDDFKVRLAKRFDDRAKQTDQDVIQLHRDLTDYAFKILKDQYGIAAGRSGQPAFWEKGIDSPKLKQDAYARMLQEGSKLPQEAYVDVLGIKEIVTQKNNWPHFENVMNIPMKGEPRGKHHYVGWLARFNEIRRVPAHSSGIRTYDEKDYEDFKHIKFEFYKRRDIALGIAETDSP